MSDIKKKLSVEEQVAYLQTKGVKFEKMTCEEAIEYLRENNNYFKITAYRKNFPKHPDGDCKGQYIQLDFAMLKDLAVIDMRIRAIFVQMALDVEHFAKVKLIKVVAESEDDGYNIISRFFEHLKSEDEKEGTTFYTSLKAELKRNENNPYCGSLIKKYKDSLPVWAFVELVSYGSFIRFYKFVSLEFELPELADDFYLLMTIKELRNACAHNNCIINEMGLRDAKRSLDHKISRKLGAGGISKETRQKTKNERMRQLVTLLYMHVTLSSSGVIQHKKELLNDLVNRMNKHSDYYKDNDLVLTTFSFFKKVVDIFY